MSTAGYLVVNTSQTCACLWIETHLSCLRYIPRPINFSSRLYYITYNIYVHIGDLANPNHPSHLAAAPPVAKAAAAAPKDAAPMFAGMDSDFRDMLFAGNDSE